MYSHRQINKSELIIEARYGGFGKKREKECIHFAKHDIYT